MTITLLNTITSVRCYNHDQIQEQQDENPDDLNQSNSLQDLDVHLNLHSLKKGHPDRPVVSAYGAR